jgi:lipopolysaccharide biosynthesis regulator YciM
MNEEEYDRYERQQRKEDIAAKYVKCEHLHIEFIDAIQNILNGEMQVVKVYRCHDCELMGHTLYVVPANIDWESDGFDGNYFGNEGEEE